MHGPESRLEFRDGSMKFGDAPGEFQIKPDTEPKQISLSFGFLKFEGIYRVKQDELEICLGQPTADGSKIPTGFDASQGWHLILRRPKPEVSPIVTIGLELPYVTRGVVAFHPDGKVIATAVGRQVILWDLEEKDVVQRLPDSESGTLGHLAFSPNGRFLAVTNGMFREGLKVWDLEAKQVAYSSDRDRAVASFNDDGSLFVSGPSRKELQLRDVPSWNATLAVKSEQMQVERAAFSSDGTLLATVANTETIGLFNVATGEQHGVLQGKAPKCDVAVHPSGRFVAAAVRYNPAEIWDIESKKLIAELGPHAESVDFSADGKFVAVATFKGTDLYRVEDWGPAGISFPGHADVVEFSPDGKYLAAADGHFCRVWSVNPIEPPSQGAVWPVLTEQQQAEFDEIRNFDFLASAQRQAPRFGQKVENILAADGTPLLSWRVPVLAAVSRRREENILTDKTEKYVMLARQIRKEEPWDSEFNSRISLEAGKILEGVGVANGKTAWLHPTGPTAAYDEDGRERFVQDVRDCPILIEVSPDRAVPWAEPRDYVVDSDNPWAGLPKEGFLAGFHNYTLRFIKPDTPAETLRAMFTADGNDRVDLDAVSEDPYQRFLRSL